MQRSLTNLSKIEQQVSSTKNFSKPSDDPLNVERSMQLQSSVDYTTQYGLNIKTANTWMETTDSTLGQIGNVLSSIRDNLEQAGNGAYKQDEKDKINDTVNQEIQQMGTLLNTNFEGEYIFGGTEGLSKPITTITDSNTGIVSLEYADKDGNAVNNFPSVESSGFHENNWNSKSITFTVDGKDYKVNLNSSYSGIDDVVKDLNNKIQGNTVMPTPANPPTSTDPGVRDKINVVKTNDQNIKFVAVNSSDDITLKDSDVSDLSAVKGKQLSNMTMENISADKNIEISPGVVLSYNATASNIMQYGSNYNTTSGDSINALVDRIQHHLSGQVLSDASAGDAGAINIPDSNGTAHYYVWKTDEDAAKKELTGQDLVDIDAASKNVLAIRSKIGAKEQRMSDLSTQNESSITNLKEVLSKTEDIDITQKTIELYTSITTYQACLQVGGKVIQPTLLDYIK